MSGEFGHRSSVPSTALRAGIDHSPRSGEQAVRLLYNTGLALLLPAAWAYYAYRYRIRKKPSAKWVDRFGLFPDDFDATRLPDEQVIWVHAVSVGEVAAAQPILRELAAHNLPLRIFLSVTTPTGFEMALSREEGRFASTASRVSRLTRARPSPRET